MSIALVTGASSGIGRSTATHLASRGAGVILTYRSNPDGAAETVAEIERAGGTAVALGLDVASVETFPAFRDAVARALSDAWGVDSLGGLVNNAGVGQGAAFADTTPELFDELYRTLLHGPYFLTQALVPLVDDGGSVVFTGSTSAISTVADSGYSAYATMKGGVVVMTRYLAKELAARGIRVNSVAPGTTRTRLGDDAFTRMPELIPQMAARTALGRIGEPEDIAGVIEFLLSDAGAWITGQTLEASGGFNL